MKQVDRIGKEAIFVIGYPKSGNTWLARLISDALDSPIVGGNNPIDRADQKQNYTGNYIVYKLHYSDQSESHYILKSSKIFYIVRDLRDILVSGFFHFHTGEKEDKYTIENSSNSKFHLLHRYYFRRQVKRMAKKWQGNEITVLKNKIKKPISILKCFILEKKRPTGPLIGNWSEHVNYWIKFPNVSVVKYEDLLSDTYTSIKKAFTKMEINCSELRLLKAIRRQSFKVKKRKFEIKGDFNNARFMRRGAAGDWTRFLDRKITQCIKRTHGITMKRLEYEI